MEALIQPQGKILVVEYIIATRLPLGDVHDLPEKLPVYLNFTTRLYTKLNTTLQHVLATNDSSLASLISHLLYTVDIAYCFLSNIVTYMAWSTVLRHPQAHTRTKCGFVDLVGMVLGSLWPGFRERCLPSEFVYGNPYGCT